MRTPSLKIIFKFFGYFIISVFFTLVLSAGGLYFYIQTPDGTKKILEQMDQYLQTRQLGNLKFSKAQIQLRNGLLVLENANFEITTSSFNAQMSSPLLIFHFSISDLLEKRLKIYKIELNSLSGKFEQQAAPPSTSSQETLSRLSPLLHTFEDNLSALIKKNPFPIEVLSLKIDVNDFQVFQNQKAQFTVKKTIFESKLKWSPEQFHVELKSKILPSGTLQEHTSPFHVSLKEHTSAEIAMLKEKNDKIQLEKLDFHLFIAPLTIANISIENLEVSLNSKTLILKIPHFQYLLSHQRNIFKKPLHLLTSLNYSFLNNFSSVQLEQTTKVNHQQILHFKSQINLLTQRHIPLDLQVNLPTQFLENISGMQSFKDIPLKGRLQVHLPPLNNILTKKYSEIAWTLDLNHQEKPELIKLYSQGLLKNNFDAFDSSMVLSMNSQTKAFKFMGSSLKGFVQIPLHFYKDKNQIKAEGFITFSDFHFENGLKKIKNINGTLPFFQLMTPCGDKFCYLEKSLLNPFEFADFSQIQPLMKFKYSLTINEIQWNALILGPLKGYASLHQNQLSLHQFDLMAGPGRFYGEFFFDFLPDHLEMGILTRVNSLDLSFFTQDGVSNTSPTKNALVNGRSGLTFNLKHGTLNGRIDFTKLNKIQLLHFLKILDPKFTNDRLNQVRSALNIACPEYLGMNFKSGTMDLLVQLSGGIKLDLRNLPTSSLLISKTRPLYQKIKEIPIQ